MNTPTKPVAELLTWGATLAVLAATFGVLARVMSPKAASINDAGEIVTAEGFNSTGTIVLGIAVAIGLVAAYCLVLGLTRLVKRTSARSTSRSATRVAHG